MSHFFNRRFHKKGYINNFFTVGSPTFEDGVVSGFSTSNYLRLPNITPSSMNSLDANFKFKLDIKSGDYPLLYSVAGGDDIFVETSSCHVCNWNGSGKVSGVTSLSSNVYYNLRIISNDGSNFSYYLKEGDYTENISDYTLQFTITNNNFQITNTEIKLGVYGSDQSFSTGSIDLKECYININGERWWDGLKRCKYDYNFTRVGTPSISNPPSCEVSGFSTSNYITKLLSFDINGDWEFITKTYLNAINASTSPTQMLFGITKGTTFGINFYISSVAVKLAFNHTPNSGWTYTDISVTVPTDRWLYVKYVKTGTKFTFYFSEDGEIFEEKGSYTFTSTLFEADGFAVGCGSSQTSLSPTSIVDLKETTIKVNGEPIWTCFKRSDDFSFDEKGTDEDYDFFDYKQYGFKYQNHRKGYINNFFVVGAPSIANGSLVSGFSSANYLTLPENFNVSDGSTWEMVYKIRTGSNVTTQQSICGHTASSNYDPVGLTIKDGKFYLDLSSGSSTKIQWGIVGTYQFVADTEYFVKIEFTGTAYVLSYSTDGVDFIEDIRKESTTPIWTSNLAIGRQQGSDSEYPFLGSIDISQCYVKVNGELWWHPYKRCKYDYNFTRVGIPSISNKEDTCEATSFTTANYLSLPTAFRPTDKSWEVMLKFTTGSNVSTAQGVMGGANGTYEPDVCYITSSKFNLNLSGNGSSWNIGSKAGTHVVLANTTYWTRIKFNGSKYTFEYSTDGETFTEDIVIESFVVIEDNADLLWIGTRVSSPFLGSIDLTQSYIKINGKLWWTCFKQSDNLSFDEKGTDEDYDFITTHPHFIEHDTKNYYKIVPWEQPILTSNTSYGALTGSSYSGTRYYYCISDGKIPTTNDGADSWGTNNTAIGWVNWALEEEILIKGIKIYNRSHTTAADYTLTGARFYTDSTKTTPIGEEFKISTSQGIYELKSVPEKGIKTNNIYFYKTGDTYSGIGELKITADKVVQSTYDDWDFYVVEKRKVHKKGWTTKAIVMGDIEFSSSGITKGFSEFDYLEIQTTPKDTMPSCSYTLCFKIRENATEDITICGNGSLGQFTCIYNPTTKKLGITVSKTSITTGSFDFDFDFTKEMLLRVQATSITVSVSYSTDGGVTFTDLGDFMVPGSQNYKTSSKQFLGKTEGLEYIDVSKCSFGSSLYKWDSWERTAENPQYVEMGTSEDYDFVEPEVETVYNNKTLKINPTPSNATVIINGEERNEIELMRNSSVSWSVSLDGYKTQSGTLRLSEDTVIDVVLIELQNYTFTINATPSDATVMINGELTNSVTVLEDSEVIYEVSLEGYVTQTGTVVVSEDTVIDVVLEEELLLECSEINGYYSFTNTETYKAVFYPSYENDATEYMLCFPNSDSNYVGSNERVSFKINSYTDDVVSVVYQNANINLNLYEESILSGIAFKTFKGSGSYTSGGTTTSYYLELAFPSGFVLGESVFLSKYHSFSVDDSLGVISSVSETTYSRGGLFSCTILQSGLKVNVLTGDLYE